MESTTEYWTLLDRAGKPGSGSDCQSLPLFFIKELCAVVLQKGNLYWEVLVPQ